MCRIISNTNDKRVMVIMMYVRLTILISLIGWNIAKHFCRHANNSASSNLTEVYNSWSLKYITCSTYSFPSETPTLSLNPKPFVKVCINQNLVSALTIIYFLCTEKKTDCLISSFFKESNILRKIWLFFLACRSTT